MTPADSPENKCPTVECPDCGGMGSGEGGFRGGKKWKAICPGCGGSGRINTSGPDDSKIENKYQGSPSVPDREESDLERFTRQHEEGKRRYVREVEGVVPSPDRVTVSRETLARALKAAVGDAFLLGAAQESQQELRDVKDDFWAALVARSR